MLSRVQCANGFRPWAVFSVVFEWIVPSFPTWFRSTADPFDVLAYAAGGFTAHLRWRFSYFGSYNCTSKSPGTLKCVTSPYPASTTSSTNSTPRAFNPATVA